MVVGRGRGLQIPKANSTHLKADTDLKPSVVFRRNARIQLSRKVHLRIPAGLGVTLLCFGVQLLVGLLASSGSQAKGSFFRSRSYP